MRSGESMSAGTSPESVVQALRTTLVDNERLRRENERLVAEAGEPVAIVSMACRLPGGVTDPESLWELVREGRDAIGPFPTDRGWDLGSLFDDDPDAAGSSYVREGGFLARAGGFDAPFFGISPREALAMDPQQRLLLEVAWEAVERAGLDPRSLEGRDVAVFAGGNPQGYGGGPGDAPEGLEGFLGVNASSSVISGRVSYTLGLTGPAVTVDTACSSSLVAIHLAVRSLRSRECSMALAGGVTVMGQPTAFVEFSRQRGLAPDGRCKSFGDGADGTSWAEGVGVLLLERLSDARRDGHEVLAVIPGSAVNQDGASNGLTAPNGPSQERVIAAALADAGLGLADVDLLEAHGTGTRLGDPIEARALLNTYGRGRPQDRPLWLGSVKSNLGHAQSASGVAGVIKVVQAIRHGLMPRTLHADEPSSNVDWAAGAVELLAREREWPETGRARRGAVSSFGVSGTNAHVIVEQAPEEAAAGVAAAGRPAPRSAGGQDAGIAAVTGQAAPAAGPATAEPAASAVEDGTGVAPGPVATGGVVPWALSGRTAAALAAQAARLRAHLAAHPAARPVDVAWSLATTRSVLEHRAVVPAASLDEALAGLDALASGRADRSVVVGEAAPGRVAVLFTGQGSQRAGAGRELRERFPVFARAFDAACAAVGELPTGDGGAIGLAEVALADPGTPAAALLDRTAFTQPALFALEVALFRLVQSWGVRPAALAGHSVGEIAAAHVAGVLSLADAAALVRARGGLMQELPEGGAMVAVEAAEDEVVPLLGDGVSLAAVNGPTSVVLSGDEEAVTAVAARLAQRGRRTKRLAVSHAFHSHRVDPALAAFRAVAEELAYAAPTIPIVSTLTGRPVTPDELRSPDYWVRHARGAVRFLDAVRALGDAGARTFLELGPEGVLTAAGADCLPDAVFAATLRADVPEARAVLAGVAGLHVRGATVDWGSLFTGADARRVPLPTYAFQHEDHWLVRRSTAADVGAVGLREAGHPLLGAVVALPESGGVQLSGRLSVAAQPWLAEHVVSGTALVPGAALVELAVRAGDETGTPVLEELVIGRPMPLPDGGALSVQVVVGPDEGGRRSVRVYSRADGAVDWVEHAAGALTAPEAAPTADAGPWPPENAEPVDTRGFYDTLAEGGYAYGPLFRGLTSAWRGEGEAWAEVALPGDATGFGIHPALLDAALHTAHFCLPTGTERRAGLLPFAWTGVRLHAGGATTARVHARATGDDGVTVRLLDGAGQPVADVAALTFRAAADTPSAEVPDALWAVEWTEHPLPADGTTPAGGTTTAVVVVDTRSVDAPDDGPARARALTAHVLAELQRHADDDRPVVVVTSGAVAVRVDGEVTDPASTAVWGLVRAAQVEQPDRVRLVDVEPGADPVLTSPEPQVALRGGTAHVPRLVRARRALPAPTATSWRLGSDRPGTLDSLALLPDDSGTAPLAPGEVRIAVRAAGLNFRDVLVALGMYPGRAVIGAEGAGVVVEVGPGPDDTDAGDTGPGDTGSGGLAVGDRVMGLFPGAFGPLAVADHRMVTRMPDGWSFTTGAGVPIAFLTALYGLRDLGGLTAGETVLVHAAAGGVGMAAVQLARAFGARVLGTAHPAKHAAVTRLGVPESHLSSSRDTAYADLFGPVDVVLNSLTGEHVDASLGLLRAGGRFLEMGKTDLRDADEVAKAHPGVAYRPFDLGGEAPAERVAELLAELVALFEAGRIHPLPTAAWEITRAPEAFGWMSRAGHVGKIVLTLPRRPDPDGTVLVTGGTGSLGAVAARHLVTAHGARHLLLASRRGEQAPGAAELTDGLRGLGADVRVAACDVADRDALAALLATIPAAHPLTAVVHTAGVLDDGVLAAQTPERLDAVFRPKVDAVANLHELTGDPALFAVYSSASGVLGGAGQTNYAAANAWLDGLAHVRRAAGLPATSLAWGLWAQDGGMTGGLAGGPAGPGGRARRGAVAPLSTTEGMALFDAAVASGRPLLAPIRLDPAALTADGAQPPALLRGLARPTRRTAVAATTDDGLAGRLAALDGPGRQRLLVELVREQAAAVLGFATPDAVSPGRAFRDLGFDSLTAVELRNRLSAATGLPLPATTVFDHPTPLDAAAHLLDALGVAPAPAPATPVVTAARDDDPIAVVAMGCRLPGGVSSPEDLWRLLDGGVDAIGPFPDDRGWDLGSLFDDDPDAVGKSYVREGGFLAGAGGFDAAFFGISPREALAMDPQQRLLLEVAWETVERAGIDPTSLRGADVGVFAGAGAQNYGSGPGPVPEGLEGYLGVGGATSVVSGRVSYTLGLTGPALTIDTACSSSLVAIHLAVRSLRSGECSMALAGGVAVMGEPAAFVEFSRQRGLAPDGRCKSFGAEADGTTWAEGAGLVLLERLSVARARGHEVLAVLRGSAVNQDGASNGLTAPNGPSQERVIRAALADAGITPDAVDAVEAHGTGTTLGDPIEAQAVLATYGQDREQPLWLGSLKSNIGHAQAAAGVASVIKSVLALGRGVLPRSLHASTPTPQVDWSSGAVELLARAREWPETGRPRRIGVSSFGVSGTNAHVVLEQAPEPEPAREAEPARESAPGPESVPPLTGATPWLLSARSPEALADQAARLVDAVPAEWRASDVGWSLATTRAPLEQRAVVVARDTARGLAAASALAAGRPDPHVVTGTADVDGRTAFVFPGQGAQWAGMGRELLDASPVFAERLRECAAALRPYTDWDLVEVITSGGALEDVDVVQPTSWAIMVSLAALWRSLGVHPDAVIGHSQGEIAAATVAGWLSLQDGAKIVALRSQLIDEHLTGLGGMMSVALPAEDIDLTGYQGRLWVAAHNGPTATVVAGDADALAELRDALEGEARTRVIPVDYASHTGHVDAIRDQLARMLADVTPRPGEIPWLSTVTGEWITPGDDDADYWFHNLRRTVHFADGITTLLDAGHRAFVEVSTHPVLTPAVQEAAEANPALRTVAVGTLRRADGGAERVVAGLAELLARGVAVDPAAVFPGARRVALPTFAFRHETFWLSRALPDARPVPQGGHPLAPVVVSDPGTGGVILSGRISAATHPWLLDHAVAGAVLLPGAALAELAVRAGDETGTPTLEELVIGRPVVLPEDGELRLQVVVGAEDGARREVRAYSRADDAAPWTEHASGTLSAKSSLPADVPAAPWPPAGAEPIALDGFYEAMAGAGYGYGPAFRGLRAAWRDGDDVVAEVAVPRAQEQVAGRFGIHPALLDAALHAGNFCFPAQDGERATMLPFSWDDVRLHATGATSVRVRARAVGGPGAPALTVAITDPSGVPVAGVGALGMRAVSPEQLGAPGVGGDALRVLEWAEVAVEAADRWAVLGSERHPDVDAYAADPDRPGALLVDVGAWLGGDDAVARAHALTSAALELVRDWATRGDLGGERLVLVTTGAEDVRDTAPRDPAQAAVWGLARSARSEHPDRFALVDADDRSPATLALAAGSAFPEVVLRGERAHAPRLARAVPGRPVALDPDGTALITGGTGALGALAARHLVTAHGVRRLLLTGRRGPDAPGAAELAEELRGLGADVRVEACDVADRDALAALLASIPAGRPLTAVVHAAGALDDAPVTDLTPERLSAVLAPKVDALANLDELVGDGPAVFAVYSSASGVLGTAGQAAYAAANTFADALVRRRRAEGRAGVSLAWGLWAGASELTGDLAGDRLARTRRGGLVPLTAAEGMALFDAGAVTTGGPALVVPLPLDLAALRASARDEAVPALLRALVPAARRSLSPATGQAAPPAGLRARLAGLSGDEQEAVLTELVRDLAAAVLGHGEKGAVGPDDAFFEIGFDSMTAVQLRNRLNTATGLRLPAALLFDQPTPAIAAEALRERLAAEQSGSGQSGAGQPGAGHSGAGQSSAGRSGAGQSTDPTDER
ncbi:SDR family NAD(P)-dependent oxidoreductase [Actinosynnema pretiosum subsp. pretiosum]|uniref:6-deoxyerythronolide-B synthase n=1 Tax=Actinosynnema pretiosum subsp. pretiosum TaxID=103721 RepID=B5A9Q1_9PSEU|nr:MbcAIII [Actinosynnema pretiosum subsp. pretiosum]QUF05214.1 SDR family NAD(P)-dependent oxidoreductase [Actinosynnema pretiosum subsp. pretiosum]